MNILNYNIKLLLVVLLSIICVGKTMAQVSFRYDSNGNRTAKEIVLSSLKNNELSDPEFVDDDFSVFDDKIEDTSIKIYPNPTKCFLRVDIQNNDSDIYGYIEILNSVGKSINKTSHISLENQIDLSNQPEGIYLMRISINGKISTWKVIKE